MENNLLKVNTPDGQETLRVLDIVEFLALSKKYLIYTRESEPNQIYAGTLIEDETSFRLEDITTDVEKDYIEKEIQRVIDEINQEPIGD